MWYWSMYSSHARIGTGQESEKHRDGRMGSDEGEVQKGRDLTHPYSNRDCLDAHLFLISNYLFIMVA